MREATAVSVGRIHSHFMCGEHAEKAKSDPRSQDFETGVSLNLRALWIKSKQTKPGQDKTATVSLKTRERRCHCRNSISHQSTTAATTASHITLNRLVQPSCSSCVSDVITPACEREKHLSTCTFLLNTIIRGGKRLQTDGKQKPYTKLQIEEGRSRLKRLT